MVEHRHLFPDDIVVSLSELYKNKNMGDINSLKHTTSHTRVITFYKLITGNFTFAHRKTYATKNYSKLRESKFDLNVTDAVTSWFSSTEMIFSPESIIAFEIIGLE